MKYFNLLFFITLIFLIISCTEEQYAEHSDYHLEAKQTGFELKEYGIDNKKITYFGIDLKLTSKKDSLNPIYLWTCDWGFYNAKTNRKDFGVGFHDCDANFLSFTTIRKGDYLNMKTTVATRKILDEGEKQFVRIGIFNIDTLDLPYSERYQENWESRYKNLTNEDRRIIWSNPIELKIIDKPLRHWGEWRLNSSTLNK